MPCPFGYTAEDDADVSSEQEEEEQQQQQQGGGNGSTDSAAKKKGGSTFEKDPVGWFYKNQIQAEKEFKVKKKQQAKNTRARMEAIMHAKAKSIEFDDTLDCDELSVGDTELSELDSDVHSIGSIRSCAESWILESEYKGPAKAWVMSGLQTSVGVAAFAVYCAISVLHAVRGLPVARAEWPSVVMSLAGALLATSALLFFSAHRRSKRQLLLSQAGLMLLYSASAALTVLMADSPTTVDTEQLSKCAADGTCPFVDDKALAETMSWLPWSCGTIGVVALGLAVISLWYTFELAFIDKKAARHTRRHRHNKHHIPWHKIKVIGPTMTCGEGGPKAAGGGGSGGKCPVMH